MHIVSKHTLRRIAFVCSAALLCSQAQALNVFACEPPAAALVKALLPSAKIDTATTPWQDPHHIEARPSLISKLRSADLLVCTGAALETGWLPVLLRRASNPSVQPGQPGHFMMAEHATLIDQLSHADRSMGDVHAEGNPHVWMSPDNLISISAALSQRLQALEASNATSIQAAQQSFVGDLERKSTQWKKEAAGLRGKNVVAYHSNLKYLSLWLGMNEVAYLEPIPGSPPTARHLAKLRASMNNESVFAIIDSQNYPEKPAKRLSADSGVQHIRLIDSVGTKHATTLIEMFDYNISQLIAGLQ